VYISVIIPTYNRLPILQQCLRALAQQQPGPYDGYEVVVVDDGYLRAGNQHLQLPGSPLRAFQAH
jgi:GT2 family glycosyltransferase